MDKNKEPLIETKKFEKIENENDKKNLKDKIIYHKLELISYFFIIPSIIIFIYYLNKKNNWILIDNKLKIFFVFLILSSISKAFYELSKLFESYKDLFKLI